MIERTSSATALRLEAASRSAGGGGEMSPLRRSLRPLMICLSWGVWGVLWVCVVSGCCGVVVVCGGGVLLVCVGCGLCVCFVFVLVVLVSLGLSLGLFCVLAFLVYWGLGVSFVLLFLWCFFAQLWLGDRFLGFCWLLDYLVLETLAKISL